MSQANPDRDPSLGVYLHVPFCATTCDFCAFYQESPDRDRQQRFLEGIEREMELRPLPRNPETCFIGGGTPGVLTPEDWQRLGNLLKAYWGGNGPAEWTVEMAPSTVHPEKLAVLREIGVTRLSVGVQSFQEETLKALGRRQPPARVEQALKRICEAKFDRWNLDLMFALPGQKRESWEKDLRQAMDWSPDHISTYCLTLEEDTPLYLRTLRAGTAPGEEEQTELYLWTWETLERGGYQQYEVSNFAREGSACLHNLNTWDMNEWIGLGPSAASQFEGRRWQNIPDLDPWLEGVRAGRPVEIEEVSLTATDLAVDALIFGLRINAGISRDNYTARFGALPASVGLYFEELERAGLMETTGSHWHLRPHGLLLADHIGGEILERSDPDSGATDITASATH